MVFYNSFSPVQKCGCPFWLVVEFRYDIIILYDSKTCLIADAEIDGILFLLDGIVILFCHDVEMLRAFITERRHDVVVCVMKFESAFLADPF